MEGYEGYKADGIKEIIGNGEYGENSYIVAERMGNFSRDVIVYGYGIEDALDNYVEHGINVHNWKVPVSDEFETENLYFGLGYFPLDLDNIQVMAVNDNFVNKVIMAKENREFIEKIGDYFNVNSSGDDLELETWTEAGVNQIYNINKENGAYYDSFKERVEYFDVDEEIEVNRQDQMYKQAFSLKSSVEDFEEHEKWLKNTLREIGESLGRIRSDKDKQNDFWLER